MPDIAPILHFKTARLLTLLKRNRLCLRIRPTRMRRFFPAAFVLALLGAGFLEAQYGPQLPLPHIGRHGKSSSDAGRPPLSVEGIVRSNDGKTLVVGSGDGRTFTLALTEKTAYARDGKPLEPKAIIPGATVQIEAARDDQDNLTATRVELLKGPAPETGPSAAAEPAAADAPEVTTLSSPVEAPGRPILSRGGAGRRASPLAADDQVQVSSAKAKDDGIIMEPDAGSTQPGPSRNASTNDLIARTKAWVASFADSLPNYVCQQNTTRYEEQSRQQGWQALDVITAQVVYENGKESYRDITIGGKKTNKSMLELGGTTSTGEFATTLRSLFSPGTQASFKLVHTTRLGKGEAAIYDFKVALRNSDWQINVGGQSLRPAYSGSVWIDKTNAEVRRLEMQADNIPSDFPLDSVEWAVDYDKVPLGTSSFFLPIHAENLGCQRGSSICMKNAIDFRNYHKFAGQSTITFGQ
jgi:hypothetical protein